MIEGAGAALAVGFVVWFLSKRIDELQVELKNTRAQMERFEDRVIKRIDHLDSR